MGKNVLIVVDMQNDFISGSLGTPEAQAIVPKVAEKIAQFNGDIFYTMDTHDDTYLSEQEGQNLPVLHCQEGTEGWQLAPEIINAAPVDPEKVYCKNQFGSVELAEDLQYLNAEELIDSIELVGLCTDICVVSNAILLKAFYRMYRLQYGAIAVPVLHLLSMTRLWKLCAAVRLLLNERFNIMY